MIKLKKVVAVALVGIMGVQLVGCGKESKKEKELDMYNAQLQTKIEHSLGVIRIIDDVLYASYGDVKEEEDSIKNGILRYDFASKELIEEEFTKEEGMVNVVDFGKGENGNIIVSANKYPLDENSDSSYKQVKYTYDAKLKQVSKNEVDVENGDSDGGFETDTLMLKDGRYVSLYMQDSEENELSIKIYDSSKKETDKFNIDGEISGLYELSDGRVATMVMGDKNQSLYEIDLNGKKIGEKIMDLSNHFPYMMYKGTDEKMFFVESGYIYQLDYKEKSIDKVVELMDSNIVGENVNYVFQLMDGTLGVIVTNSDYTQVEIDYLVKQDKSADKKKTEITIGTFYMDGILQEDVIEFNKTNDKYKIVVKQYWGEDMEDYDQAITKFNSDIASGNCPDIVDFGQMGGSLPEYVEKGVLQDISSYMEKDNEIKESDFLESIVNTFKVDGKLYVLPQKFMVMGFMGSSKIVGEKTNWTVEEFTKVANSLPEGKEIIGELTRDTILSMLCSYNLDQYIDWSKGECKFNDGNLEKVLEFSKKYKTSEEYYKDFSEDDYADPNVDVKNGKVVLSSVYLSDVSEYMSAKTIQGENAVFKGYPCASGNGVIVMSNSPMLAITAKSKNKDVAWEFIRQFYLPSTSESEETEFMDGFPSRVEDLDKALKKLTEKHYDDEGKEVTSMNSLEIGDVSVDVPYPTEQDVKDVRKIFDSIDMVMSSNEQIAKIITEESKAFFDGKKSASEVAEIIQSRVSIYVKENR